MTTIAVTSGLGAQRPVDTRRSTKDAEDERVRQEVDHNHSAGGTNGSAATTAGTGPSLIVTCTAVPGSTKSRWT